MAQSKTKLTYNTDLQMFVIPPIGIEVAPTSEPLAFGQGSATDAQYARFIGGLGFLRHRAERGEVGPKSVVGDAPTIKDVTEAPSPPKVHGPTSVPNPAYSSNPSAGWSVGPDHPYFDADD